MRTIPVLTLALLVALPGGVAGADEPEKAAAVSEEKPFVPPDGWRPKKRGQFTVYCRKDYNVKGTRFPQETCYDEAGIRAMLAAQQEDRDKVDQMRRICGNDSACGTH
jgi:hypothetical protein